MHPGQKAVVWFNGVTKKDVATVGGKGTNLGEMTKAIEDNLLKNSGRTLCSFWLDSERHKEDLWHFQNYFISQ